MRPGRVLAFLLTVVLTITILSLLTFSLRPDGRPILHEAVDVASDTVAGSQSDSDSTEPVVRDSSGPGITAGIREAEIPHQFHPGDALRDSVAGGRQVRIIYYGDSQVEGDRITSLLRQELRSDEGGTGPGMISPVMPVMYTRSYVVRSSSNWKRYTLLDYRNGTLPHNRLGPMLALCRFTPPQDTLETLSFATVRINPVPGADSAVSVYDNLRIFYGNNYDTVLVGVRSGSSLVDFAMLQMGEGPMEFSVPLPSVSDVTVEFTGRHSPDIYAISLESNKGVVVDNVPVRGSAGLEFVMTDMEGMSGCFSSLKPDIIFLHFGLNVVRNVRSEYHYYEEGLVKQINYLREASGGTPVVVVSVTDMALRDNDSIRLFPNIKAIRDAQMNAAARSGALFWDAWESMGGSGSVIRWYNHMPSLASRDLTHLSNAGTDTIASRIYSDLMVAGSRENLLAGAGERSLIARYDHGNTVMTDSSGMESGNMVPSTVATEDKESDVSAPGQGTGPAEVASGKSEVASGTALKGETGAATPEERNTRRVTDKGRRTGISGRVAGWSTSMLKYHPDQTFIFTTPAFWIFFLVVMAGFALLHRRRAMCHTWLLLVSLYFYYRAGGLFIILLLLTTLLTYLTALMTDKAGRRAGKRFWLVTNILLLLGFLSYFKYATFFTEVINSIFNTTLVARDIFSIWSNNLFGTDFNVNSIILPVGISFFTFQALSYSIDVYRGRMKAEHNLIDFAFYLTFFPQLVAGPIVRASEFIPQMRGEYTISRNEFGYGLFLILQGLIKKMLISDLISSGFIDRVFDAPAIYSGFENLMAVYGYGLQIYCDFSGYTDIAIGVAMLMGFRLPLNFNSPYKAANIGDFWRRWHISLSRWLKDYLYIPLGGNRKGWFRTGINLMITMLLGGLWHGAAARFVVWGGLHGVALIAEKIWHYIFRGIKIRRKSAHIAGILLTFNFVSFAWIFFRAGTMEQAGIMLNQIFSSFTPGDYGQVLMAYLPVAILIVSGYILHFLPVTVKESYRGLFIRLPVVVQLLVTLAVVLLLNKVGADIVQPFIYFRF